MRGIKEVGEVADACARPVAPGPVERERATSGTLGVCTALLEARSTPEVARAHRNLCERLTLLGGVRRVWLVALDADESVLHVIAKAGDRRRAPALDGPSRSDVIALVHASLRAGRTAEQPGAGGLACAAKQGSSVIRGVIVELHDAALLVPAVAESLAFAAVCATSAADVRQAAVAEDQALTRASHQLSARIHHRVVQRLFAASVVLSSPCELRGVERERCRDALDEGLAELREALADAAPDPDFEVPVVDDPVADAACEVPGAHVVVTGDPGCVPPPLAPIVRHLLIEATRNARKHAHARRVDITFARDAGRLVVSVLNDGVGPRIARRPGVGLRLLQREAALAGGSVASEAVAPGCWRVRAELPIDVVHGEEGTAWAQSNPLAFASS